MQGSDKRQKAIIGIVVIVVIALIVTGAIFFAQKPEDTLQSPEPSTEAVVTPSSSATTSTSAYKDGSYTATGTYRSPGGSENITVTVTLREGVVTATSAAAGAISREGREYQQMFINDYQSQVVGKNITSLSLDRVSGSSLTSEGFNAAIDKIKSQASS